MPRDRSKDRPECLEAQEQVQDMHTLTQAYHLHRHICTCPHRLNILAGTHHISTENTRKSRCTDTLPQAHSYIREHSFSHTDTYSQPRYTLIQSHM